MPPNRCTEMARYAELFAKLSQGTEYSSEFAEMMRDVFLNVCRTLQVSDPADPLSTDIARTLITIASEGVSDADELYKRTLNEFRSG